MADAADQLTEADRRAVFAALVAAQDRGLSVPSSRKRVAQEFDVTYHVVAAVEREGTEKEWPPLGAADPAARGPAA